MSIYNNNISLKMLLFGGGEGFYFVTKKYFASDKNP